MFSNLSPIKVSKDSKILYKNLELYQLLNYVNHTQTETLSAELVF